MLESLEPRRLFSQILVTYQLDAVGSIDGDATFAGSLGVVDGGNTSGTFGAFSFENELIDLHVTDTVKVHVKGNQTFDPDTARVVIAEGGLTHGGTYQFSIDFSATLIGIEAKGKP